LIAIAETGSGKTVGFLLPGILHINAQPKVSEGEGPIMVILTPTRELAMQIEGKANLV
jgi:superfamily II DNA/RNA helicase